MSSPHPRASVRDAATTYIEKGWQVVPLEAGKKACKDEGWIKLVFRPEDFKPDDNIGIRSTNGLVDIDCDAPEVVFAAPAFLPPTHACYGRQSKPKSHWLYRSKFEKTVAYKDQALPADKNTLIEIRVNHQSMAPPSIHPNGELVEWSGPLGAESEVDAELLQRSVRLVATTAMVARHYNPPGDRHDWGLALSGTLMQLGLTEDESKKVFSEAARWAKDSEVKDRLLEVRTTYGRSDDDPVRSSKALKDAMPKGKAFVATLSKIWGGQTGSAFILDAKGDRILANNQENVRRALEKLNVTLSFDTFGQRALVKYGGFEGTLADPIRNRIWLDIDKQFHFRPSADFFDIVLQDEAYRNSFHPVLDYLKPLQWDKIPRLDTWLIDYAQAADITYVRAISALVLIAAVRRVKVPGCKFDELLVLESEQGLEKSSALRALCPNVDWFSDDLPLNVDAKQVIERTSGKWIIEASELVGISKRESDHLKSMLSRPSDGPVRLAYARLPVEQPRQFVAVGTTNNHHYLRDDTGNRRFWPVRVKRFDVDGLRAVRDQLWAEAVVREEQGESIRLPQTLWAVAGLQQERRRIEDAWEETLDIFFDKDKPYRVTSEEVWNALHIPTERRDERAQTRMVNIMQRLGFRRMSVKNDEKKVVKGWGRDIIEGSLDLPLET